MTDSLNIVKNNFKRPSEHLSPATSAVSSYLIAFCKQILIEALIFWDKYRKNDHGFAWFSTI